MPIAREPYSYRSDPAVPFFPDDRPIIIFDGHCALCSGWAQFVVRHDPQGKFRLLAAQSPLGQALYRHYALDPEDYETNILLAQGIAWFKAESSIRMFEGLGPPWSCARFVRVLPPVIRDRIYELVAANRLRIFGRQTSCFVPGPDMKERFLE